MTQSLELLLDDDAEAAVRGHWLALAGAGLPGLAHHTGGSNRPHITIAVSHQPFPEDVERAFEALPAALPIEASLGAPILFGRGPIRILCRLVIPSQALLDLHRTAAEATDGLPQIEHLQRGNWTPHVTLARKLALHDVPKALEAVGDLTERPARAVAVRRWDSDARRTWQLG